MSNLHVYMYVYHIGAHGGQKRTVDLESQVVMSRLVYELRTEPRSSIRTASAVDHGAISPAPMHLSFIDP